MVILNNDNNGVNCNNNVDNNGRSVGIVRLLLGQIFYRISVITRISFILKLLDKHFTCAKMTALNLCFFNADDYAIWENSLTNERKKIYSTKRSYLRESVHGTDPSKIELPKIKSQTEKKNFQLDLLQ